MSSAWTTSFPIHKTLMEIIWIRGEKVKNSLAFHALRVDVRTCTGMADSNILHFPSFVVQLEDLVVGLAVPGLSVHSGSRGVWTAARQLSPCLLMAGGILSACTDSAWEQPGDINSCDAYQHLVMNRNNPGGCFVSYWVQHSSGSAL